MRKERDIEEFKRNIMGAYGFELDEQHNKNLEIIIDCYIEDGGDIIYADNYYDSFCAYASNENNLQNFLDKGAKILN